MKLMLYNTQGYDGTYNPCHNHHGFMSENKTKDFKSPSWKFMFGKKRMQEPYIRDSTI
jgi:hypothetical protein